MLPASFAADVPVFIATPTSACASAGASLVPSPVIATRLPPACSRLMQRHLVLGRRLGEEVVDARLGGDRLRGERVVAGDHHRADAHRAQLGEALAQALLDDVLEVDDAEHAGAAVGGPSWPRPAGCLAAFEMVIVGAARSAPERQVAAAGPLPPTIEPAPLRTWVPSARSRPAHPGLGGERHDRRRRRGTRHRAAGEGRPRRCPPGSGRRGDDSRAAPRELVPARRRRPRRTRSPGGCRR